MMLRRIILLLFAIALGTPAVGADYRLDQWTPADELPSWQIRDLLEGPNGYLWVATPAGLARFDGQRFDPTDPITAPSLPSHRIQSVYAARNGEIWFGGRDFLVRKKNGDVIPLANVEGMVHAISEDPDGTIWLFYGDGQLGRVVDGNVEQVAERSEGITADREGTLWVRDRTGALQRWTPSGLEGIGQAQQLPAAPFWVLRRQPLLDASTGRPLASAKEDGAIAVRDHDGTLIARYPDDRALLPWIVDSKGQLWVSREGAVEAYRGRSLTPVVRQPLGEKTLISEILEDREGNLWIGTRAEGIYRLRPSVFDVFVNDEVSVFRGFSRDRNGQLFVSAEGQLAAVSNDGLRPFVDSRGRPVIRLHVDASGSEWRLVGTTLTADDGRVVENVQDGRFANQPGRDGFWHFAVNGVWWIDLSQPQPRYEQRFAELFQSLTLPHVDHQGRLWIASSDGLFRIDGDEAIPFESLGGLPAVDVRAFHEEPDGTLWLGTINQGLLRFQEGHTDRLDRNAGLPEIGVFAIVEDDEGRLWMSGNRGLFRVAKESVERYLRGESDAIVSAHYGAESESVNPEEGGNLAAVADDGRLWFSSHNALMRVDPSMADELTGTAPLVHVEQVTLDEAPLHHNDAGAVTVPPGDRRVGIAYTAISMRDPSLLHFETRLDPLDEQWVRVGTDRHVRYPDLPPGRYTFRVRAISAAGIPSANEATQSIIVQPYVWETTAFRLFAVVAGLLLIGLLVRQRLEGHRRREATLDEQVRTRTQELAHERDRAAEAFRVIEAQAKKLEALDATKSRFFANVSHEFRTPLTLILGPLEDVIEGRHGAISDETADQIRLATENGSRLLRLVNQLLDTARLEAGRLKLRAQEEDLASFLKRTGDIFRPLAERRSIQFNVTVDDQLPPAWLDIEQFEKVLVNLLGNAFKFTAEGGSVWLDADASDGQIRIQVRDNGPGIPDQDRDRIFDRFYQVDQKETSLTAGTGIGLALARDLVELHHGSIALVSDDRPGATFEVRLPIGSEHLSAAEIQQGGDDPIQRRLRDARLEESAKRLVIDRNDSQVDRPEPTTDEDRTTILVVEDNAEMRGYIRNRLDDRYHVIEAVDGVDAQERIQQQLPDLIVSDLMMPRMDGLDLCRWVKESDETAFVPFVLLTAKASIDSRISGFSFGANDYLAKPFDARELLARIDNLLRASRRLKERLQQQEESLPTLSRTPVPEVPDQDAAESMIAKIDAAIDAHLADETFGIDSLARELGQSRRTLYRRCDELGISPKEMIVQRRLDHAKQLLLQERGSVTDVAYAVGFRSVSHFSRKFREHHGTRPSQIRNVPS